MAVTHTRTTLNTTPEKLTADPAPVQPGTVTMKSAQSLMVQNTGGVSVFLGGADVTTTEYGYEVRSGETFSVDLSPGEDLYGVAATTTVVNVLRAGV